MEDLATERLSSAIEVHERPSMLTQEDGIYTTGSGIYERDHPQLEFWTRASRETLQHNGKQNITA